MTSFFAARQAFATALSEVDGVQGFAWRPSAPKPGNAWPKWQGAETVAPGAMQSSWQIVLLLPADERAQEQWIEERLEGIVDALTENDVAFVASVEIGSASDKPALMINCRE
jgi:hypothetical protein